MSSTLATLSLQLVCNLIIPQTTDFDNKNFAVNESIPQSEPTILPSGSRAFLLANLPLQLVCQLIQTSSPGITENGTLVQVRTLTQTPPTTLPDGYVTFSEDGAAYKIYENDTNWNEARERCISEGARLAITDSQEKIAHINSLKENWESQWLHVGIHQSNTTDEWLRADNNLPLTDLPWVKDNPDGTGKCAGISFVEDGLVDYDCDWSGEYYVCEILI